VLVARIREAFAEGYLLKTQGCTLDAA